MRNALGHTVQPDVVVDSLLRVLRPGGVLVLRHFENVHHAEWRSLSSGLHQWAITVQDGHFVVGNYAMKIDLTNLLHGRARVAAEREGDWILARITKL